MRHIDFSIVDRGCIVMDDVAINEKVFIRYEGAIHQAKVVGFTIGKGDYQYPERGVAFRYLFHLGKDKDLWLTTLMYRSTEDCISHRAIRDVYVKSDQFAKAYLKGKNYYLWGDEIHGYKWNGFEPEVEKFDAYGWGIEYAYGKAKLICVALDENKNHVVKENPYNVPDESIYQTKEECKAHNAPTIVMLDDED